MKLKFITHFPANTIFQLSLLPKCLFHYWMLRFLSLHSFPDLPLNLSCTSDLKIPKKFPPIQTA